MECGRISAEKVNYDDAVSDGNRSLDDSGVSPGRNGFVTTVNSNTPGLLKIADFDVYGKDPGIDFDLIIIHLIAKDSGNADLILEIRDLMDTLPPHQRTKKCMIGIRQSRNYSNYNPTQGIRLRFQNKTRFMVLNDKKSYNICIWLQILA